MFFMNLSINKSIVVFFGCFLASSAFSAEVVKRIQKPLCVKSTVVSDNLDSLFEVKLNETQNVIAKKYSSGELERTLTVDVEISNLTSASNGYVRELCAVVTFRLLK